MLTRLRMAAVLVACTAGLMGCAAAPKRVAADSSPQGRCTPAYQWNSSTNNGVIHWDCGTVAPSATPSNGTLVKTD